MAVRPDRAIGIAAGMRDGDDTTQFGLFSMWVEREARRTGVGRALVNAVIAWATEHGEKRIRRADSWTTGAASPSCTLLR